MVYDDGESGEDTLSQFKLSSVAENKNPKRKFLSSVIEDVQPVRTQQTIFTYFSRSRASFCCKNMEDQPALFETLSDPRLLHHLPDELVEILCRSAEPLNELSRLSLNPSYTAKLFSIFEPICVDIAARWLSINLLSSPFEVIAAFSRILPLAQYLQPFVRLLLQRLNGKVPLFSESPDIDFEDTSDETLLLLLLSFFRLLSFDREIFSIFVSPARLGALFSHSNSILRYLSIRCFCLYMHAADASMQSMLQQYCGEDLLLGPWEDQMIDYRLLSLWEEKRWNDFQTDLLNVRSSRDSSIFDTCIQRLPVSPLTAVIGGVIIPKVEQRRKTNLRTLVQTPTVLENLRRVGLGLLSSEPLLLIGLAGAGKTSLISHAADAMGQSASMITLHLNEQTDLKSLLGVYSTSTRTGGFIWQPGSLAKAANEGRWVLIEDLDRAPSEVLSVILPLIKNRELIIPNRKERIQCAEGFRIIATMRSTINSKGLEVTSGETLLGNRLWRRIQVMSLPSAEVRQIVQEEFPLLSMAGYVDMFLNLYDRIIEVVRVSTMAHSIQGRFIGLRDLIKFCWRIERRLEKLGISTSRGAIPERTDDEILMDAVDCFAAFVPNKAFRLKLIGEIAAELRVPPQRMNFCLFERVPEYSEAQDGLLIGREVCPTLKVLNTQTSRLSVGKSLAFASTKASLRTMEQCAAAFQMSEPLLLVGETGIGKTAIIQRLASLLNQRLTVVNLSQQSETTDLIGGYKPVNLRSIAIPLVDRFHSLFDATFSVKKNQKFLSSVLKSATTGNWSRLLNVLNEAVKMSSRLFHEPETGPYGEERSSEQQPAKRRKVDISKYGNLKQRWQSFTQDLQDFETHISRGDTKMSFAFVQGKVVKALRDGEWVLLDEINLASPETLESISGLLSHGRDGLPSILLSEAGEVEAVQGHPDFRIFAAMNPATDAGKRDLAPGLRSRFTELYIQPPDSDFDDLISLIQAYLGQLAHHDRTAAPALASLYLEIKRLNAENRLTDGAGQRPHFSIRTLVRTLLYINDQAHIYGVRRAMYEGFCMSFLTLLGKESEQLVAPYIDKFLFEKHGNARSLLSKTPKEPPDGSQHIQFKHYWMRKGGLEPEFQPHYIITPFIEKNLMNLVRASCTRRFPILLQGPTSSGKTSMVEHLAKISGNKFVRINNHEHTDLQEYLGSYVSREDGSLRYQEGILVEALRNGYWIVLDELNLAPTDVLEALNRLLDDNRELFLPETQDVVRPHPNFMLFATQNPAGLYGGRKVLSRAFRNRFLELHFDDIPEEELEFILTERSQIAPSFCKRIVSVYRQLSILRQSSRLFEQRNSFATLRDLFRWALRRADNKEQLAANGFMLLAERVRNPEERLAVKKVIEKVMGVNINERSLYDTINVTSRFSQPSTVPHGIVWTNAMRRLFVLVSNAIDHNEPVLLVGDTGCGKTQLCQAIAEIYGKDLNILNAHVNLETGDLIGAQRPLRNRNLIKQTLVADISSILYQLNAMTEESDLRLDDLQKAFMSLSPAQLEGLDKKILDRIHINISRVNALFEWADGSLVSSMKKGQHFLLDELSLADDSVLERLNSVLEPHRSLLLAEKGPIDSLVVAAPGFQFLATMNPGGDYGKRELSAALRNRLTEIWVPQLSDADDIIPILEAKLHPTFQNSALPMMCFAKWFKENYQGSASASISVRDLLAWASFVNDCKELDSVSVLVHGACLVYIDSLGANPSAILAVSSGDLVKDRRRCLEELGRLFSFDAISVYFQKINTSINEGYMEIGPFCHEIRPGSQTDPNFALDAPTTLTNTLRIARGLQSNKPILIEGSPGVGKTTLVAALASILGINLTRINLSEQTDLTDLFGSDVPVEGAEIGNFTWSDAPFLRALQQGGWVLLDEMNLASQSVLEGLNSCLDHRQQVYIAELDQTFDRHQDFVLFATQNPHHQGGGRKGLPASFVNRFTVVYADSFTMHDLKLICTKLSPSLSPNHAGQMVEFISAINSQLLDHRGMGQIGGPWEINLRDLSRWLILLDKPEMRSYASQFLDIIISQRFRTAGDRETVAKLYGKIFGKDPDHKSYFHNLKTDFFHVGIGKLKRDETLQRVFERQIEIYPKDLPILESLMFCVENKWPTVLVGPSGCGKSATLQKLAALSGAKLVELSLNADTDAMDLIGGFEQRDEHRRLSLLINELIDALQYHIIRAYKNVPLRGVTNELVELYRLLKMKSLSLEKVSKSLHHISCQHEDPRFKHFYDRCVQLLASNSDNHVGFEWTESLLIHAVERGDWVVLDNANLCNATVLDRLNSLMEPNSCLIINEQRTNDGSIKIVRPHQQFRLFLTMDPRHGELSRAMRNRSVELFFLPSEVPSCSLSPIAYTCESAVYRIRNCIFSAATDDRGLEIALDHLPPGDITRINQNLHSLGQLWTESAGSPIETVSFTIARYYSLLSNGRLIGWREDLSLSEITDENKFLKREQCFEPVHPLVNEPRALSSPRPVQDPFCLTRVAKIQETQLGTARLFQELSRVENAARSKKSSEMNRLERSMTSITIVPHRKDSTSHIATFLKDSCQALMDFFQDVRLDSLDETHLKAAKSILEFSWDIFRLGVGNDFEDALFLTYINIGKALCKPLRPGSIRLFECWPQMLDSFQANWKLTTGDSMQIMWEKWRPATASSPLRLQNMVELELLCSRFDTLIRSTSLPLADLARLSNLLIQAQESLLLGSDAGQLVHDLTRIIIEAERKARNFEFETDSYFSVEFETICQYHDLSARQTIDTWGSLHGVVRLLAGRSSVPNDLSSSGNPAPGLLCNLARFSGFQSSFTNHYALRGNLSLSIIRKLKHIGDVPLHRMEALESEVKMLTEALAASSIQISQDQFALLGDNMKELIKEYLLCHQSLMDTEALRAFLESIDNSSGSTSLLSGDGELNIEIKSHTEVERYPNFSTFLSNSLIQCITDCDATYSKRHVLLRLGKTLVAFATTLLKSFVPDRPFDPSLGVVAEHERYLQKKLEKNNILQALLNFERRYSGCDTSVRIRAAEDGLRLLGDAPPPLRIIRPKPSHLSNLQGELTTILTSVINKTGDDFSVVSEESGYIGSRLVKENIRHLCTRLTDSYRAYDDITTPIVRFLQMLHLGISLIEDGQKKATGLEDFIDTISKATPFFGGTERVRIHDLSSIGISQLPQLQLETDIFRLSLISTFNCIDSEVLQRRDYREILRSCLQSLYGQWKEQLQTDQANEAEKSSFYRYRGSLQDSNLAEAEEILNIFPTFDENSESDWEPRVRLDNRTIVLRLSRKFNQLFSRENKESRLKELISDAAGLIACTPLELDLVPWSSLQPQYHLPAILLLLDKERCTPAGPSQNFYADANIPEVKRLMMIVEKTWHRFSDLHKIWSEHATLADVLECCSGIYQFKHREPIAKFLTKAEKLHGYIHEWQTVASKEYSAVDCYNELTALLISWRRLELSTWARLLDIEYEKCENDAKSWWFVAYEVIIETPLQILRDGQNLASHTTELISTLENFISLTSIGQYRFRLELVEWFVSLCQLYLVDFPSLSQLVSALSNLVRRYKPFVTIFEEQLAIGRKSLEQDLKQEIVLTSWKDTNIAVLRDSARRSHHKLFKVVRKYRTLLSQLSDTVIGNGLPTSGYVSENFSKISLGTAKPVLATALDYCCGTVSGWHTKPARFKNPDSTAKNMRQVYLGCFVGLDIGQELDTIMKDIFDTLNDFRAKTPKTLTESNKEEVQHLKSQKRRFYADKLRELRHMGIRSNLGTDDLRKQNSISSVIATTPNIIFNGESRILESADSYFHRFLDTTPKTRQASREYSNDLSNVEAARSSGFVEGLLFRVLAQRVVLSSALKALQPLSEVVQVMESMSSLKKGDLQILNPSTANRNDVKGALAWLSVTLGLCVTILNIQASCTKIDISEVVDKLTSRQYEVDCLEKTLQNIASLPWGLSSATHEYHVSRALMLIMEVRKDVQGIIYNNPSLAFVLRQVLPWAEIDLSECLFTNQTPSAIDTLGDFDISLLAATDKIFVVLQRLKDCLAALPTSIQDSGWLSKSEKVFSKALDELHIDEIAGNIISSLATIKSISEPSGGLDIAPALIATVMPIVSQYHHICLDLVNRYSLIHREVCKMGYILSMSFIRVASEGLCSPAEASEEQGATGNLESGTGLGEGEGAEDISKDVQDDEDLSDLAQQQSDEKAEKEDTNSSDDAVNMDHDDLEANTENVEQTEKSEDGEDSEIENLDDIDEEVGSFDGPDESAVDEKLWDGKNDPGQKDTENDEGKGTSHTEEETAAPEKNHTDGKETQGDENDSDSESVADEESEAIGREDNMDVTEPYVKEDQILDLPDDMELDEQQHNTDPDPDDDIDDDFPDDDEMPPENSEAVTKENFPDSPSQNEINEDENKNEIDNSENPDTFQDNNKESEGSNISDSDDQQDVSPAEQLDAEVENTHAAPIEAVSVGPDTEENRDNVATGQVTSEQQSNDLCQDSEMQSNAGKYGDDNDRQASGDHAGGRAEDAPQDSQAQAFKQLGDILEQWHRSQRNIKEASNDGKVDETDVDVNMEEVDFEHLANDEDAADTQALGTASDDQARNLDHTKAVESNQQVENNDVFPGESDHDIEQTKEGLEDLMELDNTAGQTNHPASLPFVAGNIQDKSDVGQFTEQDEMQENLEDVDRHLSAIHLSPERPPLTPPEEARRLWSHYESVTQDLALSLTEQLRLILAPTMATKLRGDFRTGKRLNIKRIIPYIASQFKRDKIWMRRSMPSKRNYQIMIAVDDSKSMLESASGQLAFETLALVSRSLSMLEAGELCIVSFGNEDHIRVAHEFGKPFSSNAGMRVFQQFSYKQTGTNVKRLIEESTALFRDARSKRSSSSGDLWQLQLIVSDGICEDHEDIKRLLRQAQEDRIMIVFIIVDAVKEESNSIMSLSQATFEHDDSGGKWKMKKYLEGFPFPYYLIVRNVNELPFVLSLALKQWFAEVVDVSA
ncbi:AAA ATPase midasin [Ophidiomyces ophidiicola]|nr:AAA ATPase midasin [Ophidiomyces ophidiicola]